jgi:hypothetical protein
MSLAERAAQFSPFAALTGYDEAVRETARLTDTMEEASPEQLDRLNDALRQLEIHISEEPPISARVFRPDERKSGGSYVRITGRLKRIDPYERTLLLTDGRILRMEYISSLCSPLLKE